MGRNKAPSIQWYPGDWRKDPAVQALSFHDRGIWFEILNLMAESERPGRLTLNGKAMPDDALARLLGLDKQNLTKTLTTLVEYGVASRDSETGALMNRRMVRDQELREIRQKSGSRGGNPVLLNQKVKQEDNQVVNHGANQTATPSSSSSTSSSPSGKEKEKNKKERPSLEEVKAYAKEIDLPESEAAAFVDHFTANGWKVGGKAPMQDWKAALRTWKSRWQKNKPNGNSAPSHRNKEPQQTINLKSPV